MCGRFALSAIPKALAEPFGLEAPAVEPRRDIRPTQAAMILLREPETGKPEFQGLVWGLVPFWAKDKKNATRAINARAETVHDKPTFRAAFRHRRCLIPASGFYEWRREGKVKTPFYFTPADPDAPLIMAGLWEDWTDGVEHLRSFTILTIGANTLMRPIHDRMPVILPEAAWERWLDPAVQRRDEVADLLCPAEEGFLQSRECGPVSP
jgi:putative SOS response-associated peptidase YedK